MCEICNQCDCVSNCATFIDEGESQLSVEQVKAIDAHIATRSESYALVEEPWIDVEDCDACGLHSDECECENETYARWSAQELIDVNKRFQAIMESIQNT